MTNANLAKSVIAAYAAHGAAVDSIFRLAAHGNERFSEIIFRLGETSPQVIRYRRTTVDRLRLVAECRSHFGNAVTFEGLWPNFMARFVQVRA